MQEPSPEDEPRDPKLSRHDQAPPAALLEFLVQGWSQAAQPELAPISGGELYLQRRNELSRRFPGMLVVVPCGQERTRSNDTTYNFRPGTDYLYLVGEGEPGDVLVMEPLPEGGHRIGAFVEPEDDLSTPNFFTDRRKGVFWVGPRRGLRATQQQLGIAPRPISELETVLSGHHQGAVLRGIDSDLDRMTADIAGPDQRLATELSEMRLIKDRLEVELLQEACDITRRAFEDVVRALPQCRTERDIETAFFKRARSEGNDTGYSTIAAAGSHATVLHWSRNTGEVRPGQLLLLDAGAESRRYYTADVTRTLPVDGHFSPAQRSVYELVHQAQAAALAEVRPGNAFLAPHRAAMRVLAEGLERLGILKVTAEESLRPDSQLHRRYTLHSVSHMLGLDVHDCSHSRNEQYQEAELRPGMVLTVEPGLYFQEGDLTVPEEYRGIGVRIEDDVAVTEHGHRLLSQGLPSDPDLLEAWMQQLWSETPG